MGQSLSSSLAQRNAAKLPPGLPIVIVLVAIVGQVYLPLHVEAVRPLDFPLLVIVYLVLLGRRPIMGLMLGAAVGLLQDGLTHGPVGVFGITKTVIGYLAGWTSLMIQIDFPGARSILVATFFILHQLLFWTIQNQLLGYEQSLNILRTLGAAGIHAMAALLLYRLLDRWKKIS